MTNKYMYFFANWKNTPHQDFRIRLHNLSDLDSPAGIKGDYNTSGVTPNNFIDGFEIITVKTIEQVVSHALITSDLKFNFY